MQNRKKKRPKQMAKRKRSRQDCASTPSPVYDQNSPVTQQQLAYMTRSAAFNDLDTVIRSVEDGLNAIKAKLSSIRYL